MAKKNPIRKPKKTAMKILWDWIERPKSNEWWAAAGHLKGKDEAQERFNEIPASIKPLAYVIIQLACSGQKKGTGGDSPHACLRFRCMLFDAYQRVKKEKGIDLGLPYYWWTDAIMTEPEWIVMITNGIIGWTCDSSVNDCNMAGRCRFYEPLEKARPKAQPKRRRCAICGHVERTHDIGNTYHNKMCSHFYYDAGADMGGHGCGCVEFKPQKPRPSRPVEGDK